MSILKEIKVKKRKKAWRIIFAIIVAIALALGYYYYKQSGNVQEQFNTDSASRKTITSSLSSDWRVLYKEQYELNFPIAWTLAKIYKKEWENVKKWDPIARLDDAYLKLDLDKAKIAVENAQANLNAKLASKWQESDINISQAQLESSRATLDANIAQWQQDVKTAENNLAAANKDLDNAIANLEIIKSQESLNVGNSREKAFTEIDAIIPLVDKYLNETDVILGVTKTNKSLNNAYEIFLWAKDPQTMIDAVRSFKAANDNFLVFSSNWRIYKSNPDYAKIWDYINNAVLLDNLTYQSLNNTISVLKNSLPSSTFPQESIDASILNVKNNIVTLDAQMQKIILSKQAIDNSLNSLSSKVQTQQNSIDAFEIKVRLAQNSLDTAKTKLENNIKLANSQIAISEANLDSKKDTFDPRELEPFRVAISNARKWVEEAQRKLSDAMLVSPIDWIIWKLPITKIWTQISVTAASSPFVTIINKNSLYVEAKIEEWDITRVHVGQRTVLTFNSLENVSLTGAVSFISDKAETDVNGIVTYKVEIPFDAKESWVKEWFTTQIAFEQVTKENVLSVPFEAVKEEDWEMHVILLNKEKRTVEVWINDWDNIEIISWLKDWDIIRY
ncbi:MAG: Efflux transporter, RND family, MFP subunit [uncultured bacterium (gcode 4)]|uniref:Efflux transporter, RND family, MFP subunit n=1 Tax=uncultured bacterium (gcode 4) TaxID=1234023 RepID=K2G769_9BACT|nr:MAG: Efflux transporter, RND family, MFP subunit [uncultured bacterium (gcode 4)]